ncbi:MAG: hypothetical protein LBF69_05945 [Prevotellaceae bacterium]|jgi:hypothetical protein|nr:hypothetical protein [Prevotellaceae bacterium]
MNTKQLQLVTFEQAKKLKALGFDWETNKIFPFNSKANAYFKIPFEKSFYKERIDSGFKAYIPAPHRSPGVEVGER